MPKNKFGTPDAKIKRLDLEFWIDSAAHQAGLSESQTQAIIEATRDVKLVARGTWTVGNPNDSTFVCGCPLHIVGVREEFATSNENEFVESYDALLEWHFEQEGVNGTVTIMEVIDD